MATSKPTPLSKEQRAQLEEQRRQSAALSQRAHVAETILPSLIASYPNLSPSSWVDKSLEVSELFLDKFFGIRFEKKEG